MKLLPLGFAATFAATALTLIPAQAASPKTPASKARSVAKGNWNGWIVANADASRTLGNPDAALKLTEYVSYTCPHCAHFAKDAEAPLRLTVVPKGQVSVRVSNVLRNAADVTVALLVNCGDDKRWFVRHNSMLALQDTWMAKGQGASDAQKARWNSGDLPSRFRAIASDFGLYDIAEGWGIGRPQADRCLADGAMLDKLKAQHAAAAEAGVQGTPSFAINGQLLDEAHDWPTLSKAITDRLPGAGT